MAPGLDTTQVQNPAGATFRMAATSPSSRIDPDSGVTTSCVYTVVDDFGVTINPMMLEGQVHGGVVQASDRRCWRRRSTTMIQASCSPARSWTTRCRGADNLPNFSFTTAQCAVQGKPARREGAGEAGAVGAPPALINAIVDALHHKGVRHVDMPATPSRVWQALHAAG